MDEDLERYYTYIDLMRVCSNKAHDLARFLRDAANCAPEESVIAPCVNLAAYLDQEAEKMNPEPKPRYEGNVIDFYEFAHRQRG